MFACSDLDIAWQEVYFVPLSILNDLRRRTLEQLAAARAENRPALKRTRRRNSVPYPEKKLSYLGNVLNEKAHAFYQRHGVTHIETAAESGLNMRGRRARRRRNFSTA